ncbi:conserved protein of unknown function [Magnetospirillum gryphiswaldense MSR-1 v2]|uniref:Uncharacterized protein n=1 Tax=Magnetospirillum gryphiswaldense (strain DSM 6361 / JCM 21280 / NBRC 15271 / MSR-1) TaxID=431944 RepID=V6F0Z1_MAGGM|nr:hypothetical protein [Magnetospirillum gryphiswaldense]CDK99124.1 conserved protein of unknown function [Magnetospirillum gryphiswaldense MSR-1 v2]
MSRVTTLSETGLRFLLGFAELARPVISSGILAEQLGGEARALIDAGYLIPDGNRKTVLVTFGESEVDVPVVRDGITGQFRCFHPDRGFLDVDPLRLGTFRLDADRLPEIVISLLGMPANTRPMTLVPDHLWDLGQDYLTKKKFPIYMARRLGRPDIHERIGEALVPRRTRGPSLLLTAGEFPKHLALPPEYRAIAIANGLVSNNHGVQLDKAILRGTLLGCVVPTDNGPLTHSADFDVVTVHGKDYVFRGPKQRDVVRQLVEAFLAGQGRCLTAKVLEGAECSDSVNTLAKVFSGRKDWREFITEEGGSCWIFL